MLYLKKLRHILQSRYIFKILVVLVILVATLYTKYGKFTSVYNKDDTIYDKKIEEDKLTLYIKGKEKLLVTYKDNNLEINSLSYGDRVLVKGYLEEASKTRIPNAFDYKKYLYNKKIYYIIRATSINKIENNSNYIYTVKNILSERIENLKSSSYIRTLLLSDKTIDEDIMNSYRKNGISHLFSVSGLHISFFIGIIYFYLDKITYCKKIKYIIVDIFLLFYLKIAFSYSLLRSVIMNILFSINSLFKLKIKRIDLLLLTLIIGIIVDPFIIYDISFIYSYLISFFLIMFSSKKGRKIKKIIEVAVISFLVSFPLAIFTNYEVNLISILLNIILVPIFSIVLLPLSILTLIFPIFDEILFGVINLLENISLFFEKITFLTINLAKVNGLIIIIYYGVITLLLVRKKKEYFYLLLGIVFIHYISPYFDNNFKLTVFDVGQGDSLLVSLPNNRGNILIDTGYGSSVENGIIPYLKSRGIKKIDYLIITHGDEDHIGGALKIISNYKVDNIILNRGKINDFEKKLIDNFKKDSITARDSIDIDGYKMYFLNDKIFANENDNSIVIYFEYYKYRFLLMGDASFNTEDYLLEKYNIHDISFLKVGHHGSSTSSSKDFIEKITPRVALISVGLNNSYGHPDKEVLNNLDSSIIYRTDRDGTIEIILNKKVCRILLDDS